MHNLPATALSCTSHMAYISPSSQSSYNPIHRSLHKSTYGSKHNLTQLKRIQNAQNQNSSNTNTPPKNNYSNQPITANIRLHANCDCNLNARNQPNMLHHCLQAKLTQYTIYNALQTRITSCAQIHPKLQAKIYRIYNLNTLTTTTRIVRNHNTCIENKSHANNNLTRAYTILISKSKLKARDKPTIATESSQPYKHHRQKQHANPNLRQRKQAYPPTTTKAGLTQRHTLPNPPTKHQSPHQILQMPNILYYTNITYLATIKTLTFITANAHVKVQTISYSNYR
eukprot:gene2749-1734_t